MPQNRIAFQHGQSLAEFLAQYGTEEQREDALKHRRWSGASGRCAGGQAYLTFCAEGRWY